MTYTTDERSTQEEIDELEEQIAELKLEQEILEAKLEFVEYLKEHGWAAK